MIGIPHVMGEFRIQLDCRREKKHVAKYAPRPGLVPYAAEALQDHLDVFGDSVLVIAMAVGQKRVEMRGLFDPEELPQPSRQVRPQ